MLKRALDWTFRSRETGRIVIGQWPNAPLAAFIVARGGAWLAGTDTATGRALLYASWAALAVWAADEVLRGVNPWRRVLGLSVLAGLGWLILHG